MGQKWIMRFRGEASDADGAELLMLLGNHSIEVLDNNLPKLLLVRGSDKAMESAKEQIDSRWAISPERSSYRIPDTKKKLK